MYFQVNSVLLVSVMYAFTNKFVFSEQVIGTLCLICAGFFLEQNYLIKDSHQGSHGDWKTWKNENSHGQVMEHAKLAQKSCNFVISHGVLPILFPNCTKSV